MKTLFKNYSLSKNLDVLFLLVFGILLQMTDGSPFTMKERWMIVWDTELPLEYFSLFIQKLIKTVLSIIVVIRCGTTYAYVVSAMLVIFCLLKNSAPKMMLLWLLIAGLKSILLTFIEALTGVYVCSAFGKIRKACIEFVISKALEIIFAAYLWGSVLTIYQEMERKAESATKSDTWEHLLLQKREFGRQRARSLLDESTLYKTACLNNFEFKDVPQIILQMLRRRNEMSSDSLLDPGMMLASVSNMGSFDSLKVSQSLGELGFVDLRSAQVLGLEEDETLSPQDKKKRIVLNKMSNNDLQALKFLGLTWNDVKEAQRNRTVLENDIYRVDNEDWKRLMDVGTIITKPKQGRGEVFLREIHQIEPEEKPRKRSFDFKFSWSFFNLYGQKETSLQETDDEQEEDEEMIFSEEGDENEEPTPLFMSNIKEEVRVNRIRLNFVTKKWKANAYAELYKQDYMSVIGPEVFDKATKLQKVTFMKNINNYTETVTSVSLPSFENTEKEEKAKPNFSNDSEGKIYSILSSELDFNKSEQINTKDFEGKTQVAGKEKTGNNDNNDNTDSGEDKFTTERLFLEFDKIKIKSEKNFEESESKLECNHFKINEKPENGNSASTLILSPEFVDCTKELSPRYRKRRIIIKRIGKQRAGIISWKCQNLLKNSEIRFDYQSQSAKGAFGQEQFENKKKLEILFTQSNPTSLKGLDSGEKSLLAPRNEQTHFLTELFQKPLLDVLVSYYDSKKKVHVEKKAKMRLWEQEVDSANFDKKYKLKGYDAMLHKRESKERQKRIWKSEILKTVEACRRKCSQKHNLLETGKESFVLLCAVCENDCKHCSCNALCTTEESAEFPKEEKKSFCQNLKQKKPINFCKISNEEQNFRYSSLKSFVEKEYIDEINLQLSNSNILKSDGDFEKLETGIDNVQRIKMQDDSHTVAASQVLEGPVEEEPISLYYSKAANLASPLLDMKRFIHIHYSYKHVKKKGFDVDMNGGFPLLVRHSFMGSAPVYDPSENLPREPSEPELAIIRRPMDLSFATTNAFAESVSQKRDSDQSDVDSKISETKTAKIRQKNEKSREQQSFEVFKHKKAKKAKCPKRNVCENAGHFSAKREFTKTRSKHCQNRNCSDFRRVHTSKDYLLIEKLLKMHWRLNNKELTEFRNFGNERTPIQISSTQLHSNKGRINSTYKLAVFLQEYKNRFEKKKIETQEERTKDMFARLKRESLCYKAKTFKSLQTHSAEI